LLLGYLRQGLDDFRETLGASLPLIVILGGITDFDAKTFEMCLPAFRYRRALINRQKLNIFKRSNGHMSNDLPAAALGHFIMKVNDIDTSYQFYTKLGLRPFGIFPDLAIIELRGGTHILLFSKHDELPFSLTPSHLGQRGAFFNERLDLMIDGKSRSDLEVYRTTLLERELYT
jgi:hypothetical protein